MPTSKIIRPAVFDETGEHVVPADADLNLDPVSSDPDNYVVRGSDGGAFLNGDGVLSNNGENLLKTDSADGKVTYSRSDAVSLINETVKPSIDKLEKKHDEDVDALQRSDVRLQTGIDKAQTAADKAQASADKAAESARQADEDAAAAQCTATQALNDAADAQAAADRAQARADAAYDKASDAQCAADKALDKAKEAVDSLPEIADSHATIVTAGDGIKVAQSRLGDHNVYQVSVKPSGADSGIKTGTDGVEVDLKSGGGLSKGNDGLGVDQQWLIDLIAKYCKDHTMFSQFKIVSALPDIASADVHTIYLIRQSGSSAADVGTKDSFEGWVIVSTENGVQKWEKIGYKTEVNLAGYVHKGSTVTLTGNTSGTGTVDANGNVVVNTTTSRAANADHATNADHAANADHATKASSADKAAKADSATRAANADHATNADSATSAGSATNATSATSADHATSADRATNADSATRATNADHADEADHATNADSATRATNADHATSANSATKATSADKATNADHATSANSATNANHATSASSADRASEADHAADSDHADEADHATSADSATKATNADHAKVADKLAGGATGSFIAGWYSTRTPTGTFNANSFFETCEPGQVVSGANIYKDVTTKSSPNTADLHGAITFANPYSGEYVCIVKPTLRFAASTTGAESGETSIASWTCEPGIFAPVGTISLTRLTFDV